MNDVRCRCSALLFRTAAIRDTIEIKCRRCGTLNSLRPAEPIPERRERLSPGDDACGSIFPRNR
ncbi:Com family DNA-binding transcriptional regulator [Ancylobacter sp. 3268]|uniref:Com family DNA-binding transcriptional regulator n=1 Tax=Ancylobacter sp. 3268 TaxID=2817752 RepID=UPI0038576548